MTSKLRIGLIGSGFVMEQSHMPAFKAIQDVVDVVAVAGRNEARVKAFAKRWGIKEVYHGESYIEQICRNRVVDAVDIALPNDLHLPAIVAAAENHRDIICEKPLGRNASEASDALSVARRYGVLHCYAENQVFIPQVRRAKAFIEDGALGRVTSVRSREAHSGPHSRWFWQPKRSGGGVLLDMGCHCIEVSRYLLEKRPVSVLGWTATLVHRTRCEDNSVALIKYEDGSLAQSENSWTAKGGIDIRLEVYGSEGSLFIDATRQTGLSMFLTPGEGNSGYVVEKADASGGWMHATWDEFVTFGYLGEMSHFARSILKGTKALETFEEGALVNRLIDAAYKSSKESRWIPVDS